MSRLLFFSDSAAAGCGATIRLDSGEPCLVSCAKTGVRVKKSRLGFFGPVLYNEKNTYQAASTAKALSVLFPDNLLPSGLRNPVLRAFTNAILHCSTSAEVAITLNEAIARVETHANSDDNIIAHLAELMATGEIRVDAFYDVSVLPYPTEAILMAIEREILREPSDERVKWLQVGATLLPSFQEGVGPHPLPFTGVDLAELQRTTPDLREQVRRAAQNPDIERAQHFSVIMTSEIDQVSARIDAAVRLRNARFGYATACSVRPNPLKNPVEAIDRHSLAALDRAVAKREAKPAQKPTMPSNSTSTRQRMTSSISTPPKLHPESSKVPVRSPTPSEMDEICGKDLLEGGREALAELKEKGRLTIGSLPREAMSHSYPANSGSARGGGTDPRLATMEWVVARLKREKLERKGHLPALFATSAPQSDIASLASEMIEQEVLWKLTMKVRQAFPTEREEAIRDKAWKMFEQVRRHKQGE
jgi:hypothetical protein